MYSYLTFLRTKCLFREKLFIKFLLIIITINILYSAFLRNNSDIREFYFFNQNGLFECLIIVFWGILVSKIHHENDKFVNLQHTTNILRGFLLEITRISETEILHLLPPKKYKQSINLRGYTWSNQIATLHHRKRVHGTRRREYRSLVNPRETEHFHDNNSIFILFMNDSLIKYQETNSLMFLLVILKTCIRGTTLTVMIYQRLV